MAVQYKSELRTVRCDGKSIVYTLEWKDVRNLNLRIRKDGSIRVSANASVPVSVIDAFVSGKAAYILAALKKFDEIAQYSPQPQQYVSGETFKEALI